MKKNTLKYLDIIILIPPLIGISDLIRNPGNLDPSIREDDRSESIILKHQINFVSLLNWMISGIIGLLLVAPSLSWADEITAQQLVRDADQFRGYRTNIQFTLNLTSIRPGKANRSNQMSIFVKDSASLVKFEAPARSKGQAMLFKERELWFHTPKTKRLIRMSPAQRLLGDASNGDVASTQFEKDYSASIIGKEVVNGIPCYVMALKAVDRKVTYAQLKYWVSEQDHRPVKSEHYTISGKLLKIAYYEGFKDYGDGLKLQKLIIHSPIKKGQKTIMVYGEMKKVNLPKSMFQKTYLKRLK